jgi:leucyl/phenylalanyl-tRNA--protein transferase
VIDCQQATSHLASLGAREIRRNDFVALLKDSIQYPPSGSRWA